MVIPQHKRALFERYTVHIALTNRSGPMTPDTDPPGQMY